MKTPRLPLAGLLALSLFLIGGSLPAEDTTGDTAGEIAGYRIIPAIFNDPGPFYGRKLELNCNFVEKASTEGPTARHHGVGYWAHILGADEANTGYIFVIVPKYQGKAFEQKYGVGGLTSAGNRGKPLKGTFNGGDLLALWYER